eukprot:GEMP01082462.1.p1 GENE.GEMP01082462.1~~GEMP01082462.1.p1  ORF type:complete len:153 (+),score=30.60 GEMP01082462.1:347-805(+)
MMRPALTPGVWDVIDNPDDLNEFSIATDENGIEPATRIIDGGGARNRKSSGPGIESCWQGCPRSKALLFAVDRGRRQGHVILAASILQTFAPPSTTRMAHDVCHHSSASSTAHTPLNLHPRICPRIRHHACDWSTAQSMGVQARRRARRSMS